MLFSRKPASVPSAENALPGRTEPLATAETHIVFDRPLKAEPPAGFVTIYVAMGCFWGAERVFWQLPGVWLTSVGYAGGSTPNPTYEETCSGLTGHTEIVQVIFDPEAISLEEILKAFWEGHDPTQGMRQGNDIGTQYRSAIYTTSEAQTEAAGASAKAYDAALSDAGHTREITTEIARLNAYYYAEDYHQQYLAKNPAGYCGIGGTGVSCPIGVGVASA
ncbi:MAG: peptide-methionine (S)-S-oxide reductase MsrA [Pseudomonadota bacterium]